MSYDSVVYNANQLSGSSAYQVYGIQYSSGLKNSNQNETSKSSAKSSYKPNIKSSTDKNEISQTGKALSSDQKQQISQLKKTDQKVRAHEMAHITAGGGLIRGGASYTYTTGPDGRQYATGGEVQIDTSIDPNDPDATIRKMEQVKRAALAPADPSAQDRSVAQTASRNEAEAMNQKIAQQTGSGQNSAFANPLGIYSKQSQNKGTIINALIGNSNTGTLGSDLSNS